MNYILETERLRLREYALSDSPFILELLNTASWLEFIGDRNVRSETQAVDYLNNGPLNSYRSHGFGLWLVEKKTDGHAIGSCGLLKRENLDYPDIGYAFLPEHTGYGFAYEIASEVLTYGFDKLNLPKIHGICKSNNNRSINLLEKLGLHFESHYCLPDTTEKSVLYTLKNDEMDR
ncbi:GNAT family N-acetyltransferase [Persicitalea jodogahamensis]|uniref:Alanine acetyltransferase n=1 Tax=Persicitalea jodogahamensis TaxID=402147 RepID=A0A8J3DDE8_9BACT|nr:GNAT family N-acetyltransferase [Persicitalea jodogahamensis]GHB80245.1 alanine acetyltransferase [Persicitalea jodogahamensis]